ncbi:LOW QUALITY PROTEIN: uncharacterized protein [Choristoneura fumiferana]
MILVYNITSVNFPIFACETLHSRSATHTMLSTVDLERLITVKRREIEKEKTRLGLASPRSDENRENNEDNNPKGVSTVPGKHDAEEAAQEATEDIPPDLERYIRRYIGLPGMLKAGEYSPNNPLVRGERGTGDALLGLGEYERRRNTLRKLRQQQYREYLDQQAKKKQEEREQAERVRREREQREKEREERERKREREREALERDRASPERRAHASTVFSTQTIRKVDTGVQTNGPGRPLSVAVQTDDAELYRISPSPLRTRERAERELSPRAAGALQRHSCSDFEEDALLLKKHEPARSYKPSLLDADAIQMRNEEAEKEAAAKRQFYQQELKNQILEQQRIREERKAREKMLEQAEMRRLEEQLRMLRMAQEREIGKQIDVSEQMKENATDYEKKRTALQKEIDLEQKALLRVAAKPRYTHTAQSDPSKTTPLLPPIHGKQNAFTKSLKEPFSTNIPDNSIFSHNYDVDSYLRKNLNPSKESLYNRIDTASSAMSLNSKYFNNFITDDRRTDYSLNERQTGYSRDSKTVYSPDKKAGGYDNDNIMKISYNSNGDRKITGLSKDEKKTFTFNDRKAESNNNEVRTNYNQNKKVTGNYDTEKTGFTFNDAKKITAINDKKVIVEKAMIHDRPKEKKYEPSIRSDNDNPIPVLRHSPVNARVVQENTELSEAMQVVDDKWKVPAVQKNILKSLPNEEGKSVSILTQLGSIRRQLQLEQLKLDNMLPKDDA